MCVSVPNSPIDLSVPGRLGYDRERQFAQLSSTAKRRRHR